MFQVPSHGNPIMLQTVVGLLPEYEGTPFMNVVPEYTLAALAEQED